MQLLRFEALKLNKDFDQVLKVIFKVFNGEDFLFNYDKEASSLELGKTKQPLIIQHSNYNFLRIFKIRRLKLNGLLSSKSYLQQIRVLVLDISNAEMPDYDFLKSTFSIKKLIIREGQIPTKLKAYLLQYIEVIET